MVYPNGTFTIRKWNFGAHFMRFCLIVQFRHSPLMILYCVLLVMLQLLDADIVNEWCGPILFALFASSTAEYWAYYIPFASRFILYDICFECRKQNTLLFAFTLYLWKCMFWQKLFVCLWRTPYTTMYCVRIFQFTRWWHRALPSSLIALWLGLRTLPAESRRWWR